MPGVTVHICLLLAELEIPDVHSLKQKRSRIKKLVAKLQSEFRVSVAEVGKHDTWQSAVLAVTAVSGDQKVLDRLTQKIEDWLSGQHETVLSGFVREFL